jgi:IS5 family transposase
VDLGVAAAPDETTILRFRHLLEQHDLCGEMLDTVNRYLETKGNEGLLREVKEQTVEDLPDGRTKTKSGKKSDFVRLAARAK